MKNDIFDNNLKITVLKPKESKTGAGIKIITTEGKHYSTAIFSEDIFTILIQQNSGDKILELEVPYSRQNSIPESLLKALV